MSSNSDFLKRLSNENTLFLNFDLKLCFIILFIVVFCIIISLFTSVFSNSYGYEYFTNDIYSLFSKVQYSNYSRIPLTADNSDIETDNNVVFGYAVRSVSSDADYHINPLVDYNNQIENKPVYFIFEVNANLYVLGGQVYDQPKQAFYEQKYYVKLLNEKTKESLILGDLIKDGDGMYKLHYKTDAANMSKVVNKSINDILEYNIVEIVYGAYDTSGKEMKSQVVIKGDLNRTP